MVNPAADFPAAHSMDSGWFAVDKNGRVAHFSTGEAGAMPQVCGYLTGEAGGDEARRLFWEEILPWMARNMDGAAFREHAESLVALFDTAERAEAAAVALDSNTVRENNLFVDVPISETTAGEWEFATTAEGLDGFVGYAPGPSDIEFESLPAEFVPIAMYTHGNWDIPGDYTRLGPGLAEFRLDVIPENLAKMDTDFTEAAEVQLADFYANEDCVSWSEADLRDGSIPERPPRQGFWGWLFNVLRGGS